MDENQNVNETVEDAVVTPVEEVKEDTTPVEEAKEEIAPTEEKAYYEKADDTATNNTYETVEAPGTTAPMVMGIISVALCWWIGGNIASIVLGAIAISKANKYVAGGFPESGKIKAGKITGMIGMIIGIVSAAIWTIFVFGIGCVGCLSAAYY